MKAYVVGGWVRDQLLEQAGRPVPRGDRDWVVVGSTPAEMIALGYKPVGRDFPVFLHPQTAEEYALARTERKTGPGYRGFVVHAAPDVTLEQDLERRDLTINAMALDEHGQLVDPLGGREDLRQRVLRHAGPAFVEDPVRLLRLARFAARFADFTIAAQTLALARQMVDSGEADALVPERVWQELARGLMEAHPARMIEVLDQTGLLARLVPEIAATLPLHDALERCAPLAAPLPVRVAVLFAAATSAEALRRRLEQLRAATDCLQLAPLLLALRRPLAEATGSDDLAAVLERADALRRAPRFAQLLLAVQILDGTDAARWQRAAAAYASIDAGAVARQAGPGADAIAAAVRAARRSALAAALGSGPRDDPTG